MVKFWHIVTVLSGVLFSVILYNMVMKSQDIRDEVQAQTEFRGYSDINNVVFTTNQGTFEIQLENEKAPKTVTNFIKLVQSGFYDGQRFHRVIEDFMIQGGDPLSKDLSKKSYWGTGGPGYKFEDEFGEGLSNVTGTISMANAGPNTNGSQFFINTADNVFLDKKHAVFGKVISGMDVVMNISKVPRDQSDKPLDDVIIEKVEVK